MRDYNQTVEGEIMPPAVATLQRPQTPTSYPGTFSGNNEAMPAKQYIITVALVVILPAIVAGMTMWAGAPSWLAVCLYMVLVVAFGVYALLVASGDFAPMVESRDIQRTERKRLDETANAVNLHYTHMSAVENNRHTEEMARIAATAEGAELSRRIAGIEENMHRLLTARSEPAVSVRPANYVPATVDDSAMRAAVKAWVLAQYAASGEARSLASVRMPWNGEWTGQPWCADAKRLMLDEVLAQHGTVYRMRDRYATRTTAIGAMASW